MISLLSGTSLDIERPDYLDSKELMFDFDTLSSFGGQLARGIWLRILCLHVLFDQQFGYRAFRDFLFALA